MMSVSLLSCSWSRVSPVSRHYELYTRLQPQMYLVCGIEYEIVLCKLIQYAALIAQLIICMCGI